MLMENFVVWKYDLELWLEVRNERDQISKQKPKFTTIY